MGSEAFDDFERVYIEGYASFYNEVDRSLDMAMPGSFKESVELFNSGEVNIKMLHDHDTSKIIGSWTHLVETDHGLYVKGYIDPNLPHGLTYIKTLNSSKLKYGLSIGYRTKLAIRKGDTRILKKIHLTEISITQDPVLATAYFEIKPRDEYRSCVSVLN